MSRRRSTPWIHRWSRPLIGAIALLGAVLTAYLTVVKLTGGDVSCTTEAAQSTGGCNNVLSSAYAEIFGLPLSLFGLLAYAGMAAFALAPLAVNRETNKRLRTQLENWTWLLLLAGATAMTVFSGYLMYVLAFALQTPCPYCIASATFSLSFLVLTLIGHDWEDLGQVFFTGIVVAMVTIVGTLGVYSGVNSTAATAGEGDRTPIPVATTAPQPPKGWDVTTTSGESERALAQHLNEVGVTMYGAYWCPHCYEQKQLFGKQAVKQINYIECDPRGKNPQPQLCQEAGIRSYPSWEINGQIYRGTQTLEELARATDYQGPTDFKYSLPGR